MLTENGRLLAVQSGTKFKVSLDCLFRIAIIYKICKFSSLYNVQNVSSTRKNLDASLYATKKDKILGTIIAIKLRHTCTCICVRGHHYPYEHAQSFVVLCDNVMYKLPYMYTNQCVVLMTNCSLSRVGHKTLRYKYVRC